MGEEKSTTQQDTTQRQVATPTEQEQRGLNRAEELQIAAQPGMLEAQAGGLNLINRLLTGEGLPGYLGGLPGGISSEAIGTQASRLARQYGAGFQQQGLADSGVAFRETARGIGSELLYPSEMFNIQNLSQLLNLAVGGQAQIQQPIAAQGAQLSQALAGLRPVSGAGMQTGVTTGMNPFLKSFQTGLGGALGGIPGRLTYGDKAWGLGISGG